jgi:hypothetical protein
MERIRHSDKQISLQSLLKPGDFYELKRVGSPTPTSREFFLLKQRLPQDAVSGDVIFVNVRGQILTCLFDQTVELVDVGILPRVDGSWVRDKWLEVVDDYLPALHTYKQSIPLTIVV